MSITSQTAANRPSALLAALAAAPAHPAFLLLAPCAPWLFSILGRER
jgi:hypothetical protein